MHGRRVVLRLLARRPGSKLRPALQPRARRRRPAIELLGDFLKRLVRLAGQDLEPGARDRVGDSASEARRRHNVELA